MSLLFFTTIIYEPLRYNAAISPLVIDLPVATFTRRNTSPSFIPCASALRNVMPINSTNIMIRNFVIVYIVLIMLSIELLIFNKRA